MQWRVIQGKLSFNRVLPLIILLLIISVGLNRLYPISLNSSSHQFAKIITAKNGTPLRIFADDNGVWRYPVTLKHVSPLYIQALIHYEDRWFWQHFCVNPLAIARAFIQNMSHRKVISGGSTLTMQVARLLSPHSKTIHGKIKQIFIALQLEFYYSKTQILEYYLNHAPFGGTLEGVQAASYSYLGKSVKELTHAEAALLAVLPQAPSRYRPDRHPQQAISARDKVLQRLAQQNVWDRLTIQQALTEPLIVQANRTPMIAPLLARRLKKHMANKQTLTTTIDIDLQLGTEALVKHYVAQLPAKTSAAVLIVDNKTLGVNAYIGSADFLDSDRFGHFHMVSALRSPGSTLKPFLYGIAIDEGLIHSESLLTDAPLSFDHYQPQNFSRGFAGPVSMSQALQRSLNIPAVQVLSHLSAEKFVSHLKNAGLTLQFNRAAKSNLSIILGGIGSNLETLVGAYTALANQGLSGKLRFLANAPLNQRYLLSAGAAWVINNTLSQQDKTHYPLAWKTGTSYGHRDFWSIGVTPRYTIGVWIGRPDGTPLSGHYGSNTASPLLFSIADSLVHSSYLKQPDSVIKKDICWPLGNLKTDTNPTLCHQTRMAWIVDDNVPLTLSNPNANHWESNPLTLQINPKTGFVINPRCKVKQGIEKQIALWPLAIEPWIEKANRRKHQIGKFDPSCDAQVIYNTEPLSIDHLKKNSQLRAAGTSKKMPRIKLSVSGGQGHLYWFINAQLKYTVTHDKPVFHQFLSKGKFQITVVDDTGRGDSIDLKVI